ncbi:MAG: DUF4157 domain-containing protein [Methanophagales archaeon ANME-1-THS]|nr:MAG: DUF4157 domain-containing protein [Methanophagales archaeon ANME-1-THS]
MKASVRVSKELGRNKDLSRTRCDTRSHQHDSERQFGSLREVIGMIKRTGGTPSVDSIATELSPKHSAERTSVLRALQQTHGNRYVQRVVAGIQAKLKVGQPGDLYEQEADRVADMVMRMPQQVDRKRGKEELLRTRGGISRTLEVTSDLESHIQSLKGSGQPLPSSLRAIFEPRFGVNFSQVRLHADTQAAELAQAVNARAFTVKQDLVFGVGEYSPGTLEGRKLLAHELTHVVQQENATTSHPHILHRKEGEKPAKAKKGLEVDLSDAVLTVFENSTLIKTMPVVFGDYTTSLLRGGGVYTIHGWLERYTTPSRTDYTACTWFPWGKELDRFPTAMKVWGKIDFLKVHGRWHPVQREDDTGIVYEEGQRGTGDQMARNGDKVRQWEDDVGADR